MTTERCGRIRLVRGRWTTFAVIGAVLMTGACGSTSGIPKPDASKAAAELASGLKLHTAGKLAEAADHYQEALKYDPKNKYALYDLALIDSVQANQGLAEDKYRIVLSIDPSYEPALFNLALLVKAKGDNPAAIALYRRAVAANPKDAAAHLNLGLLLRTTGDRAAGDHEVTQALKLDPSRHDPAKSTSAQPTTSSSPSPSGSVG